MNETPSPISARERDTIVQALAAGVVPRNGLRHLQVGRAAEVGALLKDIERVGDSGAAIRFIIGEYGAGKTFFLNLIRLIALEKKLVTVNADLGPDRRLLGTDGQARGLYAEAVRNMATRTKPDGGALASVMERFLSEIVREAETSNSSAEKLIDAKLAPLQDEVGGFDYAVVLKSYLAGSQKGDEDLKNGALRWNPWRIYDQDRSSLDPPGPQHHRRRPCLRFPEAARLVREAGGIRRPACRVRRDGQSLQAPEHSDAKPELRTDSPHHQRHPARQCSVRRVRIRRDAGIPDGHAKGPLQLSCPGKPTRREQLRQRRPRRHERPGEFRLQSLSVEDLMILPLQHPSCHGRRRRGEISHSRRLLKAFMTHCSQRIGEAYFRTPRSTIKAFVNLLSVLEQNPSANWREMLGTVEIAPDNEAVTSANLLKETTMASPSSASETVDAFDRLIRPFNDGFALNTSELSPIQVQAIRSILETDKDILISASTAAGNGGRFSACAHAGRQALAGGLSLLYVSPLKALINDQMYRLDVLCEQMEIPITPWHGDAPQSGKSRLLEKSQGIALITPELIEAMFVRHPENAQRLLSALDFIIIDEVHAFMQGPRGLHLGALLKRIDALSAKAARASACRRRSEIAIRPPPALPPTDFVARVDIKDPGEGLDLQLQIRGDPNTDPAKAAKDARKDESGEAYEDQSPPAITAICDHLYATLRGSKKTRFFGGSRKMVETVADTFPT